MGLVRPWLTLTLPLTVLLPAFTSCWSKDELTTDYATAMIDQSLSFASSATSVFSWPLSSGGSDDSCAIASIAAHIEKSHLTPSSRTMVYLDGVVTNGTRSPVAAELEFLQELRSICRHAALFCILRPDFSICLDLVTSAWSSSTGECRDINEGVFSIGGHLYPWVTRAYRRDYTWFSQWKHGDFRCKLDSDFSYCMNFRTGDWMNSRGEYGTLNNGSLQEVDWVCIECKRCV
jgi:hypothetical protein